MSYRQSYETLDQDHPERFNDLISVLSNPSTSDEQRSEADSLFNSCKETDPNTVVDKLLILLEHSPDIDVRKMSATLLGNIFEKYESTRSRPRVVEKLVNLLEHSLVDVRKMSATLLGNIFEKSKSTQSRVVVDKLRKLLEHSLDIDVRKMSAILLGNIFEKSKSTPSPVKISFLLDCVVKKENRPIIEVLGDTISKLAPYEKVADTLFKRLASDDTSVQESVLLICPQLVQYVFSPSQVRIGLHDVFKSCQENVGVGSANVRIAALIAATSFIQSFTSSDWLQNLLPGMMQCLDEVLNGEDEAMKQKAFVLLVKLAETKPSFFRGQLVEVVESMLQIADTESLEERTRDLAIEFVITLVEYVINCKLVSYIMPLHGVFKSCLENVGEGSANVRIAALIAATSFIQCLMSDVDRFQDLLPGMMQCLVEVLKGGDEAMKQKALVSLIKLAETKPSFFKEGLVEVVWSMLQIAYTESLEEGTRNLAIEFVITLLGYVIKRKLVSYIKPLHGVFKRCLENVGSANVRIAALIAATSFIQWLRRQDRFQDLLPGMMQCLVEVLNGGDEAMKQKALVLLIKLAETKPRFFKERLVEVVWSMLQIAEAESLEEGTMHLAIEFVITLEKVSNRGSAIHVRAMLAFLLGNLFKQCHPMSESTDSRVKGYLLACVVKEENKPIIEILGYSISMLAPDKNVANILLDHVATLQESALLIFPHVVQYLMASKVSFTMRLRNVFKNHRRDVGSANVRIAALIAATSFIQCVMSSSDGDWFQGLLMQCLNELFNGGDETMTQKALVLLIELAETKPSFFTKRLVEVVGSMSQIANAVSLEEGTRRLAKKFVITLEKAHAVSAVVNISDNFPPDTSMPDMLEIVGNLRQFGLQEGIASDQTRTPAIEKLLKQFREKLPPKTWASTWSSLRLESILAHKEN